MAEKAVAGGQSALHTLMLDVHDLVKVITDVGLDAFMDQMITSLRESVATLNPETVEHKIRGGFNYEKPEHGLVEWMPTMVTGEVVSVKTVGYHPANPVVRNVPSVLATTALYDTTTGHLKALCEATLLTAIRTGAASAVVTELATAPGPITLGVVGCGAQAVTQIHAISRVRPIERLVVTDIKTENAHSLADRLPPGVVAPEVLSGERFNETLGDFDVICTCTSVPIGEGPVIDLGLAAKNLHVNAVGADFPGKTEIPIEFVRSSVVIPDMVEQCMIEGESQVLEESELGPTMAEVLAGRAPDLTGQQTLFDSTGWSFEDLLAAQLFVDHARRLGLGTSIDVHLEPDDPYDPYETIST